MSADGLTVVSGHTLDQAGSDARWLWAADRQYVVVRTTITMYDRWPRSSQRPRREQHFAKEWTSALCVVNKQLHGVSIRRPRRSVSNPTKCGNFNFSWAATHGLDAGDAVALRCVVRRNACQKQHQ